MRSHRLLTASAVAVTAGALALSLIPVQPEALRQGATSPRRPIPSGSLPGHGSPTLLEPDGGRNYYAKFPSSLPSSPSFFPIGIWLESVIDPPDTAKDQAIGLNTYVGLVPGSNLRLVEQAGMHVLGQAELWAPARGRSSQALAGWLLADEIDMNEGPVKGSASLTRVVQRLPRNDGRLLYTNYGKGVTFWEPDAEASAFVSKYQDVASADNYWFTDGDICGSSQGGILIAQGRQLTEAECRLAANYGRTVDRLRSLINPNASLPVWNYVEVGHPFTDNAWPSITPPQVRAAVWSGIIHGARGIVYFNHSFGGPAMTQHALREPAYEQIRQAVAGTNRQLTELAPVLNGPTVTDLVENSSPVITRGIASTAGTTTTGMVDILAKWSGGHFYLLVGSTSPQPRTNTLSTTCVGDATATVIGESRTLPVESGRLTDTFSDGNAVHIYRIDGGGTCGLS